MRDLNQVLMRKETTPGTALTDLSGSDVTVRLTDESRFDPAAEAIETGEMQHSSSSRPSEIGAHRVSGLLSWILRPSLTPAGSPPPCHILLEMGMFRGELVKEIAIGAVTGGPFQDGETIRVGGNDRGKVFRPTSASPLKYTVIGGVIASGDTITGLTSGASAAATGSPASKGYLYRLVDSDFFGASDTKHHATIEYLCGGLGIRGRGCLGELAIDFRNGRSAVAKSQIAGAWDDHIDKALYDVAAYPDEGAAAPRFSDADFKIGSYKPTDIVDCSLNVPLGLELREDANHAAQAGILCADYDRRNVAPTLTIEPALTAKAGAGTFDFFGSAKAGSTFAVAWRLGASVYFYADEAQILNPGFSSRRNLKVAPITLKLCGTKNNELQIYFAG